MPLIGVIADDLTGATTAGVLLARHQIKATVFFREQISCSKAMQSTASEAILISTNSRSLDEKKAYTKVKCAALELKGMGAAYISKRIDTTLRGLIGCEIDALMDSMEEESVAVVVPTMPQSKRIVAGGYSIIDGEMLADTAAAKDVKTPVKESFVPHLIQRQTRRKVGHIGLSTVLQGKNHIKANILQLVKDGCRIVVVDSVSMEHISAVAKACVRLEYKVIAVDPGPFTVMLAKERGIAKDEENRPVSDLEAGKKTVLIAAGSATPVTKKQMEILCRDTRVERISVDPEGLLECGTIKDNIVNTVVIKAVQMLDREPRPRAILFETALHDKLLNLAEEDRIRDWKDGTSSDNINQGLGEIISRIMKMAIGEKVAGIYATGGDTLVHVCSELGAEAIQVLDYLIPQTDIGRLTGAYEGLPIVAKGGLTGHDTIVCEIVKRILQEVRTE